MLPKNVYSKVKQGLRNIRDDWEADLKEDPDRVPYEVTFNVRMLIERCMREGRMPRNEAVVDQTIQYLITKGDIVGSPYGGLMLPLPPDAKPLPSKEEFVRQTRAKIRALFPASTDRGRRT